jgi:hypothetical protein
VRHRRLREDPGQGRKQRHGRRLTGTVEPTGSIKACVI